MGALMSMQGSQNKHGCLWYTLFSKAFYEELADFGFKFLTVLFLKVQIEKLLLPSNI